MRNLLVSSCLFFVCFINSSQYLRAQTDSIFWFGAPEVIADHGDRPIRIFCSSTLMNVEVVLSQPANPNFKPISVLIPIGASHSFDLTNWISLIETQPNQILNNGLLLKSTGPITAYYEVMPRLNPDIFSFKGNNALGTEFWIPGQNHYYNGPYGGIPRSGYVIVATEDNTIITIRPKNDLVGHPAGVPFSITLNKGQCYATRAIGGQKNQHVGGDYVIATKKIAITLKDDSLGLGIGCWDLGGDQLIPTNIIGTDYIIRRGSLVPEDRYFITATMDNTTIFINGSNIPIKSLDAGEIGNFALRDPSVHISSNNPIYVLHVTGFGCELGFGIVPPYPCTGSRSVYFTRSNTDPMGLFVFTRTNNISAFKINNNSATLSQQSFDLVPGTNGDYSSAYIDLSNVINVGVTTNINNTSGVFHVGIINGRSGTSSRYGYFSNFGRVKTQESDIFVCKGDTVTLFSDSIYTGDWYSRGEYLHSESILKIAIDSSISIKLITEKQFGCVDTLFYNIKVAETYRISQRQQICQNEYYEFGSRVLSESGIYTDSLKTNLECDSIISLELIVNPIYTDTIFKYSCFAQDTGWHILDSMTINSCDSITYTYTSLNTSKTDTIWYSICKGDSINIHGDWATTIDTLFFNNTSKKGCDSNQVYIINELKSHIIINQKRICFGQYFKDTKITNDTLIIEEFSNSFGCDSLEYNSITVIPVNLKIDTIWLCQGDEYLGKRIHADSIIRDTFSSINDCDSLVTTFIRLHGLPLVKITGDSLFCKDTLTTLTAHGAKYYTWSNGHTINKINVSITGKYILTGIDSNGCLNTASINISSPELNLLLQNTPPICTGIDDGLIKISNWDHKYNYYINGKLIDSLARNLGPGNYIVKLVDQYGCTLEEQAFFNEPINLNLNMPDSLSGYVGNTIEINPNVNLKLSSSKWKPSTHLACDTCLNTEALIQKTDWLYYLCITDYRGCKTIDSIYIKGVLRNIYVPNVFSPNNDNINDKFTLYSNDGYVLIEELKIYSRWGELLYVGVDFPFNEPNYGWNGIFNNKHMNPGVFAYVARVLRTDGITEVLYGDVTLVK